MDDSWDMNEVIPNLWLGDLRSAQNTEKLRQNNIHSILSAMRGKVVVAEVCILNATIYRRHRDELINVVDFQSASNKPR